MIFECPHCNTEFDDPDARAEHGVCDAVPAAAHADGCPLCGAHYDSYLNHIHNEH